MNLLDRKESDASALTRAQVLDYVHELLAELINMTRSADLPTVAHLFEMTRLETETLLRRPRAISAAASAFESPSVRSN